MLDIGCGEGVLTQRWARAIRPPSSGNAGSRLKPSRTVLISASQPSSTSGALTRTPEVSRATSRKWRKLPKASPASTQTPTTIALTSGPAAASANSAPGEGDSPRVRVKPPSAHRSTPSIVIPWWRATTACPSSWATTVAKNSSAPTTATMKAWVPFERTEEK